MLFQKRPAKIRVKLLSAQINALAQAGESASVMQLLQERNFILTNGNQLPFPKRTFNQRQKRKRNRQNPNK